MSVTVKLIFLIAATLSLGACGLWQKASDSSASVFHKQVNVLNVDFRSRASLNADEASRSSAVVVRVYQLKDRKAFDAASYADLLANDKAVLGADLEDVRGVVLRPEGSASVSQPMRTMSRYVAVVAYFRDVNEGSSWRRVVTRKALSPDQPLVFELVDNVLVAASDAPGERPGS
jgi:type VI secretion system protein VasD